MGQTLSTRAQRQFLTLWDEHKRRTAPPGQHSAGPLNGQLVRIAKLTAEMAKDGSATAQFWYFDKDGASQESSEDEITAYDWMLATGDTIASGSKVVLLYVGQWVVIDAECPA